MNGSQPSRPVAVRAVDLAQGLRSGCPLSLQNIDLVSRICSMPSRIAAVIFASVLALLVPAAAGAQSVIDPHAVYEQHCFRCHAEHGADLARMRMKLADGILLVRRDSGSMERLLRDHQGVKLTDAEQKSLLALFIAGIKWDGIYQHRCARCHGPAVSFAREKLAIAGDRIVAAGGKRDAAEFLKSHGEASAGEISLLIDMLRFQLETRPH